MGIERVPVGRKKGFVYVVDIGIDGLYKIGKTVDLERRMKELQASNPLATLVVGLFVCNYGFVEKTVHDKYAKKKHSRELYHLSGHNIRDIRWYLKQQTPRMVGQKAHERKINAGKRAVRVKEQFRALNNAKGR